MSSGAAVAWHAVAAGCLRLLAGDLVLNDGAVCVTCNNRAIMLLAGSETGASWQQAAF